jgi:CDP-diacylglycerol--glycerol-3-phosphate 3-phosphatidyltransferase
MMPSETTAATGPTPPTAPLPVRVAPLSRGALSLPNLITLSRIALAFVLFGMIWVSGRGETQLWLASAALFLVAASTDFLDGYIARKYGMVTTLGRILDPFADKMIIGGAFIFLLEKQHLVRGDMVFSSGVNAWIVTIVIGREIFITSLRAFLEQHGRDFSASMSGKIKMVLQCAAVTASILSLDAWFGSQSWVVVARDVLLWAAVVATIYSGVIYVQRAAQMLREG